MTLHAQNVLRCEGVFLWLLLTGFRDQKQED